MGRGGGGGGFGGGGFGGGFSGGGGGGHIGGGFSGGRVGGSSHSGGGSSWGGSRSSGSSGWGGGGHSYGGPAPRSYGSSGGSGLFPPLWWWIWGNNSNRNNNNYNNYRNDNNNNGGGGPEKKPDPQPEKPERKTTGVGCLSAILIVVAIILAITMISGISAAKNAKNRVKLDEKVTVDIGYIDDQLNWFDKPSTVESAMKTFYDKTGVMPYLIISNSIGGCTSSEQVPAYLESLYKQLFVKNGTVDQTHFLVYWYQENGSDDYAFMYAGSSANGVVDSDARDVVMNYFNRYYSGDYDDNQYFAKVFTDSAEEIMKQSDTGWKYTLFWLIAVIAVLIIMNVIDYKNTMKIKKQEAAAKILNANIEDPGWKDEAEDLADKYTDEASELASKYESKQ